MADDITEFLRRAAIRRAQMLKQQKQQARQQGGVISPADSEVVVAEVIEKSARSSISKMEQQVARDIDTSAFAQRADRLGDVPEQADERMGEHLHTKFDHKLGNIAPPTEAVMGEITAGTETRVAQSHPLLDLLQNAQSLRSAIILGELLRRPEQHW